MAVLGNEYENEPKLSPWPRAIERKPMIKINAPKQVKGVECPGMWYFLNGPFLSITSVGREVAGPKSMRSVKYTVLKSMWSE